MKWLNNASFYTLIMIFLVSTMFVTRSPIMLILNKAAGAGFFLHWAVFSRKIVFSKGLLTYLLFLFWCVFSFVLADANWDAVWVHLKTMLQLSILLFFVYAKLIVDKPDFFKNITIILLIYFIFAYFGQSFGFSFGQVDDDPERFQGNTANANALGFIVLYALISTLYLLEIYSNFIVQFFKRFWILPFLLAALLLLPTGSRKSFISLCGVFFFFLYIKQGSISKTIATVVFGGTLFLFIAGSFFLSAFEDSIMGERFLDESKLDRGVDVRSGLYDQGLDFFMQNPLTGIGLNNFNLHSHTGHMAHSYYIELLADTGIIGFLIIFSIYFTAGRKSFILFKNNVMKPEAIFIMSFIFITFIMSFGFSYHRSFDHWILLTFIWALLDKFFNAKYAAISSPDHRGLH